MDNPALPPPDLCRASVLLNAGSLCSQKSRPVSIRESALSHLSRIVA